MDRDKIMKYVAKGNRLGESSETKALYAENERLRNALAFYADRDTWRGENPPIKTDVDGDMVATYGKRARSVVGEKQ